MISLNGCTLFSDFEKYSFNELDSGLSDSSYMESDSNVSDAGISDSSYISDSNYSDDTSDSSIGLFPIISFIIDGEKQNIETSMCLACKTDNDCLENEHCTSSLVCAKSCSFLDSFCNDNNQLFCAGARCYPNVGCALWNK